MALACSFVQSDKLSRVQPFLAYWHQPHQNSEAVPNRRGDVLQWPCVEGRSTKASHAERGKKLPNVFISLSEIDILAEGVVVLTAL